MDIIIKDIKPLEGRDFIREKVRQRDNWTCQKCGKIWEEGTRRLDVHHLDEKLESNRTYQGSRCLDRMITLCHKCHLNLPHVKKKIMMGRRICL
jgi:5-methylcytosine-specific restriction endonuclease McrA